MIFTLEQCKQWGRVKGFRLNIKGYLQKTSTNGKIRLFGKNKLGINKNNKHLVHHIVAIDYGIKKNILRNFSNLGCKVTVVPADTTFELIEKLKSRWNFFIEWSWRPCCNIYICKNCIQKILEKQIPFLGFVWGINYLVMH